MTSLVLPSQLGVPDMAEAAISTSTDSSPRTVEGQLLAQYGAGDESAMNDLISRYQDQAFWVARHVVHNDEVALDVVQDAFVRVIRNWQSFDDHRSSFKAWFYQIVRNMAIDHLRKAKVRTSQELVEQVDEQVGPNDVERSETAERIQQIMTTLSAAYRELLIWRDVEGISPQDIAGMLNIEYGTARWRIHQARKAFRKAWIDRFGEELA